MPITYTNRKGLTFYLCRGVTKTGKPRYFFAREPKGEPVEEIPEEFTISESVNGIVSLTKVRPMLILPAEVAAVEQAIRRHPKSYNYRMNVRPDQIEVYERVGGSEFTPVLRFILLKGQERAFYVQRWCYLGSIDDWIDVGPMGSVEQLARKWIHRLGTDAFFEVY